MGRRGRRQAFLEHWHRRSLELSDGSTLTWVAMSHVEPHRGKCFAVDGPSIHPSVGACALVAASHPDAGLASPGESTFGPGRVNP